MVNSGVIGLGVVDSRFIASASRKAAGEVAKIPQYRPGAVASQAKNTEIIGAPYDLLLKLCEGPGTLAIDERHVNFKYSQEAIGNVPMARFCPPSSPGHPLSNQDIAEARSSEQDILSNARDPRGDAMYTVIGS